jgi:hypothetical protein
MELGERVALGFLRKPGRDVFPLKPVLASDEKTGRVLEEPSLTRIASLGD